MIFILNVFKNNIVFLYHFPAVISKNFQIEKKKIMGPLKLLTHYSTQNEIINLLPNLFGKFIMLSTKTKNTNQKFCYRCNQKHLIIFFPFHFIDKIKNGKNMEAKPIQIVTTGEAHTFVLDEDSLTEVLLQDHLKDRFVVVVSVAGAFRKGKSFLLDFFLRYMYSKVNTTAAAATDAIKQK